jgi:glycosyltransferase involved in cell wall biosynthesis
VSSPLLTVTALTASSVDPSSRFRVRQHITPLKSLGIDVVERYPFVGAYSATPLPSGLALPRVVEKAAHVAWYGRKVLSRVPGAVSTWKSDITWLQRPLIAGKYSLEWSLKRPMVFDIDDAVWLHSDQGKRERLPKIINLILKSSTLVIAGNNYLAEWARSQGKETAIVPTAIDTDRFVPREGTRTPSSPYTVGWTGTSSNFVCFAPIEEALRAFLEKVDGTLLIIADKPFTSSKIPSSRIVFEPWSEKTEASLLHRMDVGIMPLPENEWTLGKCSFKMLQYMATGLPVVVSPVGLNSDILNKGALGLGPKTADEWYDSLLRIYNEPLTASGFGAEGRRIAEESFSVHVVSKMLNDIFRSL